MDSLSSVSSGTWILLEMGVKNMVSFATQIVDKISLRFNFCLQREKCG